MMTGVERDEKTRSIILEHYKKYPLMQITDFFKLLFHSAFGCEHAVTSVERAEEYIVKESETVECKGRLMIETLDGEYCRVYLNCLNQGVTPKALAHAFCASAKAAQEGRARLEEKLIVLRTLVLNKEIDISLSELDSMIEEWRRLGYPAVRHSEIYRESYKPAYRVLSLECAKQLLNCII